MLRVGMGFQKGTKGLAVAVFETSPSFWARCCKNPKTSEWKETSSTFSSQTAKAQKQKWVNDRNAFRLIQSKNDRPFKCDY